MTTLTALEPILQAQLAELAPKSLVPGYVAAVYHAGQQIALVHGIANLNTGAPMTADTGWLLGSITKVLTTTALLRLVERGQVDLDQPVVRYLPDFRLSERGAAERILVRHLVNHTNGIDADTLMPTREFGPGAVASYISAMAGCGTLFEPGTFSHYTNPGFTLAGRIIELLTGLPFNEALEREIYATVGMPDSSTSATQAILRRTAIGAFADPATGGVKPSHLFMLPVSAAPAGATPIVTAADLIAFGRTHLNHGVSPNGTRVISRESAELMRTPSFGIGTPNCEPSGLGWRLTPIGGTVALGHGGGSPGGTSSLVVFPELDLIVVGFGSGPGSVAIHDAVIATVLKELAGRSVEAPYQVSAAPTDLTPYEGEYRHFQSRTTVKEVDGVLEIASAIEPCDDDHRRFMSDYMGGTLAFPAVKRVPLTPTLFGVAGAPPEMFYGVWGRMGLVSFHQPGPDGRFKFMHTGWRAARRTDS